MVIEADMNKIQQYDIEYTEPAHRQFFWFKKKQTMNTMFSYIFLLVPCVGRKCTILYIINM